MKRLPGVIFSAIILILFSLLQLLFALGIGFAGVFATRQGLGGMQPNTASAAAAPAWMPVFMLVICGFFAALAIWGILTAVGLFRIRRWARYSVLVIGGALAVFGLLSMLVTLAMMAVPGLIPASANPAQAQNMQAMMKVVFAVIAFFYGVICAVGVSWLVYFNLKKVRDLFQSASGKIDDTGRPLPISAIAVLNIIGAVTCLASALLPLPGAFMGMILHGWAKATCYLVFAVLLGAAGFGLWRLLEWGRRTALVLQAIGLAQYIVYLVRPSLMTRYIDEVNRTMNLAQPQPAAPFQSMVYGLSFAMGILFLIAIAGVLHHYRGAFQPPVAAPQAASPELP